MFKIPKRDYTAEFKGLAVKHVTAGEKHGVVAKDLGLNEQTLRNWVEAASSARCT